MSSQTAVITGASGLLGRAVTTAFNRKSWSVTGTGLTRANPPAILAVDLSDAAAVAKSLDDVKPSVVVHCTPPSLPSFRPHTPFTQLHWHTNLTTPRRSKPLPRLLRPRPLRRPRPQRSRDPLSRRANRQAGRSPHLHQHRLRFLRRPRRSALRDLRDARADEFIRYYKVGGREGCGGSLCCCGRKGEGCGAESARAVWEGG